MDHGLDQELVILIAEDDDGHAELIKENLQEAGVRNRILRFRNGQEAMDFFHSPPETAALRHVYGQTYLLLLDINMPRMGGIEVLRRIKNDPELKKLPVMMLTTTDDPNEISTCYSLGCSCYVTKPVDYRKFTEVLHRLGLFIPMLKMPRLGTA
ncbi:response regulator [Geobacter sp. SVR]|uniref:response regulator n=1 Tax=Geobacter sp. SVR TaxID=2495594 RepID=UPI00143EF993|nr:response regulator [Geobacter sp. SVR]BCS55873.1 response regulator [Geobacter sp. SVR]GCF83877.1 response regulator [Geobacter sp. SVR]